MAGTSQTADYRSLPENQTSDYRSLVPSQSNSSKMSYAEKAKKSQQPTTQTPKKDQAIILNAIDTIPTKEYVLAIGKIVNPANITFASKISNNRICIYLKTKEIVDKLIDSHPELQINDTKTEIRRMINPAKRIIISNVCPHLPHASIELALQNAGLKLTSSVNYLRAGFQEEGFNHILSFRRQVYVSISDKSTIPETLEINDGESSYRIFLTEDNIKCFICKQPGHIASKCKNSVEPAEMTETDDRNAQKRPPTDNPEEYTSDSNESNTSSNEETPTAMDTEATDQDNANPQKKTLRKKKNKKLKSDKNSLTPIPSLDEQLEPIKDEMINNPEKYVLSYDNFKDFIENTRGNNDPKTTSMDYTEDTEKLSDNMEQLYKLLTNRSMKNRFTRIKTKLKLKPKPITKQNG